MIRLAMLALLALALAGCAKSGPKLDDALTVWREGNVDSARAVLERVVKDDPGNVDARVWLADAMRRRGDMAGAVESLRRVLAEHPDHGFAHLVLAFTVDPVMTAWEQTNSDTAQAHYERAANANPPEPDGWLHTWKFASMRGDTAGVHGAMRRVVELGFLTPAARAWGRAMLSHLPANAVLFTNGDMDTYPALAAQAAEGFRTDVAVVNLSMLNVNSYARAVSAQYALPLPPVMDEADVDRTMNLGGTIAKHWKMLASKGQLPRPLFAASTVMNPELADFDDGDAVLAGTVMRVGGGPRTQAEDEEAMAAWVRELDPKAFAGPFVAASDRSPIRQAFSNSIGLNVANSVFRYAGWAAMQGDTAEARLALGKLEGLSQSLVLGDSLVSTLKEIRERVERRPD